MSTQITEIGKELRKLRIDRDERLMDMAGQLEKSASFISAVEVGKKVPPAGFAELVIRTYALLGDAAERLRVATDRSRKAFTLEASSILAQDTAGLMARRMDALSEDELNSILAILKKKD